MKPLPVFEAEYPLMGREFEGRFFQFEKDINSIPKGRYRVIQGVFFRKDHDGVVYVEDGKRKISDLSPIEDMDGKRTDNTERKYPLSSARKPILIDDDNITDGHHRVARLEDVGVKEVDVYAAIPDLKEYFRRNHCGTLRLARLTRQEWLDGITEHGLREEDFKNELGQEGICSVEYKDGTVKIV